MLQYPLIFMALWLVIWLTYCMFRICCNILWFLRLFGWWYDWHIVCLWYAAISFDFHSSWLVIWLTYYVFRTCRAWSTSTLHGTNCVTAVMQSRCCASMPLIWRPLICDTIRGGRYVVSYFIYRFLEELIFAIESWSVWYLQSLLSCFWWWSESFSPPPPLLPPTSNLLLLFMSRFMSDIHECNEYIPREAMV